MTCIFKNIDFFQSAEWVIIKILNFENNNAKNLLKIQLEKYLFTKYSHNFLYLFEVVITEGFFFNIDFITSVS